MFKNKFLFLPFAIFITAFLIDKILLLERIQTYFTKTMSEVNFQLKPELYEDLKIYLKKPGRRKVLVYFGTSRALLFDNSYIESKYPEWILYNFSVPGGTPDYTKYWLEKFRKDSIKPDFVLLDHSIELYNSRNKLQIDEVLLNGIDGLFLFRHINRYSSAEVSDFISKRLFQVYKYRPGLSTIIERTKNNYFELERYRKWRQDIKSRLRSERGSASLLSLANANMYASENDLKKMSEGDFQTYLGSFQLKQSVLEFQKENVRILKEMNISYAAIWVRLSRPYLNLILNRNIPTDKGVTTAYNAWIPEINKFHKETNSIFFDMNHDKEYNCDKFSDSGHMAPTCYHDYSDYIFQHIRK